MTFVYASVKEHLRTKNDVNSKIDDMITSNPAFTNFVKGTVDARIRVYTTKSSPARSPRPHSVKPSVAQSVSILLTDIPAVPGI